MIDGAGHDGQVKVGRADADERLALGFVGRRRRLDAAHRRFAVMARRLALAAAALALARLLLLVLMLVAAVSVLLALAAFAHLVRRRFVVAVTRQRSAAAVRAVDARSFFRNRFEIGHLVVNL